MLLQMPELALTLTKILPAVVGVRFAGVHVRPVVTVLPLQVAAGAGVITIPTVPVVAVMAQAKVGTELLLERLDELLLGAMLEELNVIEEELDCATELLLGATLDELGTTDGLLPAQD